MNPILFAGLCIYFLPTAIAFGTNNRKAMAIFIINLFLGWTLLGWVIALSMSVVK